MLPSSNCIFKQAMRKETHGRPGTPRLWTYLVKKKHKQKTPSFRVCHLESWNQGEAPYLDIIYLTCCFIVNAHFYDINFSNFINFNFLQIHFSFLANCSQVQINNSQVKVGNEGQLVITCNPGYTLIGSSVLSCLPNGLLNGTLPSCSRGTC